MFIALATLLSLSGPPAEPVFEQCKKLLGTWEGTVGKSMKVQFTFKLTHGGQVLESNGVVGVGTKNPMHAHACIGWDPVAKQVYYLDQHGADTIYFGHVTREGDDLIFDFNALSGDTGHYRSVSHVQSDSYGSTMATEKDGKWVDMGFHIGLHRV